MNKTETQKEAFSEKLTFKKPTGFTLTGKGRSVRMEKPFILAPMAGVSDLPFRRMALQFGAGSVVSEMIASWAVIRENCKTLQMARPAFEGGLSVVQMAGSDPEALGEAAKMLVDGGADVIDLNFGCPVKKVAVGQKAGCALMCDEQKAAKILQTVVEAVPVPVTLKMRTGWDHTSRNAPALAKIAEDVGIQMITVHGRTGRQLYSGQADWDFIREVREATGLPLIVNGDITDEATAVKALTKSQADGIMIGRGAYGRPWLIGQIAEFFLTGKQAASVSLAARKEALLTHYRLILEHYGTEAGLRIARKHINWYAHGLAGAAAFRAEVSRSEKVEEVIFLIDRVFEETTASEGY